MERQKRVGWAVETHEVLRVAISAAEMAAIREKRAILQITALPAALLEWQWSKEAIHLPGLARGACLEVRLTSPGNISFIIAILYNRHPSRGVGYVNATAVSVCSARTCEPTVLRTSKYM